VSGQARDPAQLEVVTRAIAALWDVGCPCGVSREEPERLDRLARRAIRRYLSARRRHKRLDAQVRFLDLVRGLSEPLDPTDGPVPRADVECLATAVIRALTGDASPDSRTHAG
jgi:hypothetical protein